jgi:hypothetical protein
MPGENGGVNGLAWSGIALALLLAIAITARIVIEKRQEKGHGVHDKE